RPPPLPRLADTTLVRSARERRHRVHGHRVRQGDPMNPNLNAARIGLSRGWIEFLATFRNPQELLFGYLFFPAIFLAMALFFLDEDMGGGVSVGTVHMAAGIALIVAIPGVMSVAQVLATEREDGTLLRSTAVPHGIIEYTLGKAVHVLLVSLLSWTLMVIPAVLFVD